LKKLLKSEHGYQIGGDPGSDFDFGSKECV